MHLLFQFDWEGDYYEVVTFTTEVTTRSMIPNTEKCGWKPAILRSIGDRYLFSPEDIGSYLESVKKPAKAPTGGGTK